MSRSPSRKAFGVSIEHTSGGACGIPKVRTGWTSTCVMRARERDVIRRTTLRGEL